MEAIILAGGFGTRLREAVPDWPKPMAPMKNRKPFLAYLFDFLEKRGVKRVILATGFQHEVIHAYFGERYHKTQVEYSQEKEPLGTGGAIKKAMGLLSREKVFILNGDTFFNVDLTLMEYRHTDSGCHLTVALKKVDNQSRFGSVETRDEQIVGFNEKEKDSSGYINGGMYCVNTDIFDGLVFPERFSFETDFLKRYYRDLKFQAFISDGYFVDIGIPEDYFRAQRELELYI